MPKVTCKRSCFFSEEQILFNQDEVYNVNPATWKKMLAVGMDKHFEPVEKGKQEPAEKPEPAPAPAAPATPKE